MVFGALEAERHNGIATRNARLGTIHVFARYLAGQRPEHLGVLQRIIGMPFKRGSVRSESDSPLVFRNARGQALTRYGVRYLLRRYVQNAARVAPSLKSKKLHPHSIRHSTAIALLKSGVDFATISQWL